MENELEHKVSLETLSEGSAVALVNRELQKIWDNIADLNTKPKAKRAVTLTLTFMPDDDRKRAQVDIDVKSTLAPDRGAGATIWFGKIDGKNGAAEANPLQVGLFDKKPQPGANVVPIDGRKEGQQ